jgi:ribonuclease HI
MAGWLVLNTDASKPEASGDAAIGAILRQKPRSNAPMKVVAYISEVVGRVEVQEAEYRALIAGLNLALRQPPTIPPTNLQVFVDSATVADQISGRAKVRGPLMEDLHKKARELLEEIGEQRVRISWLPRELNREADQRASDAFLRRSTTRGQGESSSMLE